MRGVVMAGCRRGKGDMRGGEGREGDYETSYEQVETEVEGELVR